MDIDLRYTRHQVARGSRPDAVRGDQWFLIKNASFLRLTYQIRLLTFKAEENSARLVIRTQKGSRLSGDLTEFLSMNRHIVRIERV